MSINIKTCIVIVGLFIIQNLYADKSIEKSVNIDDHIILNLKHNCTRDEDCMPLLDSIQFNNSTNITTKCVHYEHNNVCLLKAVYKRTLYGSGILQDFSSVEIIFPQ